MRKVKTLECVSVGEHAVISDVNIRGPMRRRMQDLGFFEGNELICLFRGCSGEPVAFFINGTVIALRQDEMSHIYVNENSKSV